MHYSPLIKGVKFSRHKAIAHDPVHHLAEGSEPLHKLLSNGGGFTKSTSRFGKHDPDQACAHLAHMYSLWPCPCWQPHLQWAAAATCHDGINTPSQDTSNQPTAQSISTVALHHAALTKCPVTVPLGKPSLHHKGGPPDPWTPQQPTWVHSHPHSQNQHLQDKAVIALQEPLTTATPARAPQ